jgi:hypothetical protein
LRPQRVNDSESSDGLAGVFPCMIDKMTP